MIECIIYHIVEKDACKVICFDRTDWQKNFSAFPWTMYRTPRSCETIACPLRNLIR